MVSSNGARERKRKNGDDDVKTEATVEKHWKPRYVCGDDVLQEKRKRKKEKTQTISYFSFMF